MSKLEEIEKKVKKELLEFCKSKSLIFGQKEEETMKKVVRKAYIKELEELAINSQPPMFFADLDANKDYAKLRTIVLSIFSLIENRINFLIRIKLDRNFSLISRPEDGIREAISILLDEKSFYSKIETLERLYKNKGIEKSFLTNLANIRNAFAHSLIIHDPKYKFGKKNIVSDLKAFDDFTVKAFKIAGVLNGIAEMQPEFKEFMKKLDEFAREKEK